MKLRAITFAVTILAIASGSAMAQTGGTLGLYYDAEGTICDADLAVYAPTTMYVLSKPDLGLPQGGISGAEFRIKGATDQMLIQFAENPASSVAFGNPFSDESLTENKGGCNIAFPVCELPDVNNVVLLYTITMTLLSIEPDIEFEFDQKDPPTNANNAFAHVTACDNPIFSPHEVIIGRAYMNHDSPGGCTVVAVEERTWGSIKKMYN